MTGMRRTMNASDGSGEGCLVRLGGDLHEAGVLQWQGHFTAVGEAYVDVLLGTFHAAKTDARADAELSAPGADDFEEHGPHAQGDARGGGGEIGADRGALGSRAPITEVAFDHRCELG